MSIKAMKQRYWTSYWKFPSWKANKEFCPLWLSGSNRFSQRGVSPGDLLYVVSQEQGDLLLGGRMCVARVGTRKEVLSDPRATENAKEISDLHDSDDWAIGQVGSGTPLRHGRRLSGELSAQLKFVSPKAQKFVFDEGGRLDVQTTRGVRELTAESASLLDEIISLTDVSQLERILVDDAFLVEARASRDGMFLTSTDEVKNDQLYQEGTRICILVNRYERDAAARRACIQEWGTACFVCGMSFGVRYGPNAEGLIHVHHLTPLSEMKTGYQVDPKRDLRPVCPNCHMVIHHRKPALSIPDVKALLCT